MDEAALAKREIIYLDIANDEVDPKDYTVETDPKLYHSEKTGRGPLVGPWIKDAKPKMCCYKLVTIKFKVFGFETKVEQTIAKVHFHSICMLVDDEAHVFFYFFLFHFPFRLRLVFSSSFIEHSFVSWIDGLVGP